MSVIWRKVWRDLWRAKLRTFLVVLSTAVGVFALGFVYGMSGFLSERLTASHRDSVPPHLTFFTGLFGEEMVEAVREEPGVADAEGQAVIAIRWKKPGEDEWKEGALVGRADWVAQRILRFDLVSGHWPEDTRNQRTIAVERTSARHFRIPLGSEIVIEVGRTGRRLPVEGILRHPQATAPPLGNAVFFATPETVAWLAGWPADAGSFDRLYVRMDNLPARGPASPDPNAEDPLDAYLNEAGERLQERIDRMGVGAGGFQASDPFKHPVQEQIDALLSILTVLGALSLALSAFLIVNMMNATTVQQVWQIGVMKVVGATAGRILQIYLAMALAYGLLALCLAVLPGAIASYLLGAVLLNLFNVDAGPFHLMPAALGIQLAVGLVVPPLAALVPAIGGARITPHRAISSYGLGGAFGKSWFDRLIGAIRGLPRPLALSVRNTFRRKARITLTMITLVLGGVMFIVVLSVSASMNNTLEVLLNDMTFDALLVFRRSYRETRLVQAVESVPGVRRAEVWDQQLAQLQLPGGSEREMYLWGVPLDTQMHNPRIISGRGLVAGDNRAILLNSKIADDEGIQVGDAIDIRIGEKESTWTVVGLMLNVNNLQRDNYVPFGALTRETGSINRGALVMVQADQDSPAFVNKVVSDLRAACDERHLEIAVSQTAEEARQANKAVFDVITYLMLAMSVLAAVVGSVGLMSTMSINVVERSREIAVMRAIGATSVPILGIFCAEGVLVGVLSWLLAVPLSYPGARLFSDLVSNTLFKIPLDFQFSALGALAWLFVVGFLSAVASMWPALRATQVSVRESLAYE
jgi:putative ABC transport system permease protein